MATARSFRMPGQVILLDLVGTLLMLAGIFDLVGLQLPAPFNTVVQGNGTALIGAGVGMMIIGAVVLVTRLLAQRKAQMSSASYSPPEKVINTVERRPR